MSTLFAINQVAYPEKSLLKTIMSRQSSIKSNPGLTKLPFRPLFQLCVGQLAVTSLFAIAIPSRPAQAFSEFQICAAQLVRLAAVSPEQATIACSDALRPKDISRCVVTIHRLTPTLTANALEACTKVRRPVELSRCVSHISQKTRESQTPEVINYCRRSLLPLRYSDCVVGLSREIDFSPTRAMETCIRAENFPRDSSPALIPAPPPNPTRPVAVPDLPQAPTNPVRPVMPTVPRN